jgi:hypothetical protein
MSNHFWYGFALGIGIAFVVVLVSALMQKVGKNAKQ